MIIHSSSAFASSLEVQSAYFALSHNSSIREFTIFQLLSIMPLFTLSIHLFPLVACGNLLSAFLRASSLVRSFAFTGVFGIIGELFFNSQDGSNFTCPVGGSIRVLMELPELVEETSDTLFIFTFGKVETLQEEAQSTEDIGLIVGDGVTHVFPVATHDFPAGNRGVPTFQAIIFSTSFLETAFTALCTAFASASLIFLPFERIFLIAAFAKPYFSRA